MLLQANAIALILNAIADELEKLYNDLYNAGFYAIALTGQEENPTGGKPATVKMSKAELQTREDNASAYLKGLQIENWPKTTAGLQDWTQAQDLHDQFLSWATDNVEEFGVEKEAGFTKDMPESVNVKIDTYPFSSEWTRKGLSLKRQTPNQFLAKIQQKLQDSNDPNTPTFSSSAPVAALIGLVGVPDVPQLRDFVSVLQQITAFLGTSVISPFVTLGDVAKGLFVDPFISKGHLMTLYGVRKYKYIPGNTGAKKHFNGKGLFEKGMKIIGEDSGIALEVIQVKGEFEGEKLGDVDSTYAFDPKGNFDYARDQILVVEAAWSAELNPFPQPIKLFKETNPGELVVTAVNAAFDTFEMDNNGMISREKIYTFNREDVAKGVIYAYKNKGGAKPVIMPPAWSSVTLVDAFPAYGRFLGNILVFSNFLRSFAGTILEELDKIIKFIDDIIAKMEDIVESITALLAFFESLKDIGMYGLVVQGPEQGDLLQGGTPALINAIGSAVGDDATPIIGPPPDYEVAEKTFDPTRIKPPETLKYTAGFCLVFGGASAGIYWENIQKILPQDE